MKTSWLTNLAFILGMCFVIVAANFQILVTTLAPHPFMYTNIPFTLNAREYTPKTIVIMTVSRCSTETTPVAVVSVKELYNSITGAITPLPPGSGIVPPGCTDTQTAFSSVFPDSLEPGTYVIRGVTTFRGRFSTVDIAWQTQPFIYVKDD